MNIIKYIGVGICLLIALAQVKPVYLIISEIFQSQDGLDPAFLMGKLAGHLLIMVVILLIGAKVLKIFVNKVCGCKF